MSRHATRLDAVSLDGGERRLYRLDRIAQAGIMTEAPAGS